MVLANVLGRCCLRSGRTLTSAKIWNTPRASGRSCCASSGLKEQGRPVAEATELRLRAVYGAAAGIRRCTRAITFLRGPKDDADTIARRGCIRDARGRRRARARKHPPREAARGYECRHAPVVGAPATVSDEADLPKPVNGESVSARGPFLSERASEGDCVKPALVSRLRR